MSVGLVLGSKGFVLVSNSAKCLSASLTGSQSVHGILNSNLIHMLLAGYTSIL